MRTRPYLTGIQLDYLETKDEVIIEKKTALRAPHATFPTV